MSLWLKEILGFERAQRESESSWRGYLSRFVNRGPDPNLLRLVISDEHKGILPVISDIQGSAQDSGKDGVQEVEVEMDGEVPTVGYEYRTRLGVSA